MKLLSLFMLLAVAGRADGPAEVRIQVNFDGSLRYLTARQLTTETKTFSVVSRQKWTCEIRWAARPAPITTEAKDQPAATPPDTQTVTCTSRAQRQEGDTTLFAVLTRDEEGHVEAWIPVYRATAADPPWAIWVEGIVGLASLLVALYLIWNTNRIRRMAAGLPPLKEQIAELKSIEKTLQKIAVDAQSGPSKSGSEGDAPSGQSEQVDERTRQLAAEIADFCAVIEKWQREYFRLSGVTAGNFIDLLGKLMAIANAVNLPPVTGNMDLFAAFKQKREEAVTAMVTSHDTMGKATPELEQHLQEAAGLAQLNFIYPQKGTAFDSDLHKPVARSPTRDYQQVNCVARTVVRGLQNDEGVIKPAEVSIYDKV